MTDQVVREKKEKSVTIPLLFDDHEASEQLAANLIAKHHHDLAGAKIKFLCRNKAPLSGGEKIPGNIKKASPMEKHLCGGECDFIMVVCLDVWNDLSSIQRTALVDHLLTRCVAEEDPKSGEMKYKIRPPEVREFAEIAERYGTWNEALVEFNNCLKEK
jgi:hypothetical protein